MHLQLEDSLQKIKKGYDSKDDNEDNERRKDNDGHEDNDGVVVKKLATISEICERKRETDNSY